MIWLVLSSLSWAGGSPLVRPSPSDPVLGECPQSIPIRKGEAIPDTLAENGIAKCSAVAEPTSSLAHLLAVETYSIAADELHGIDLEQRTAERDLFRSQLDEITQSTPWYRRPKAHRWLGRIEAAVFVGIIAGGYVAIERGSR